MRYRRFKALILAGWGASTLLILGVAAAGQ
ncbi:MAG: hypothetical protein AVDCRST_MAG23-2253 [uncultured Sphingosinicella sp.]|uniref:Uncharacterized protein n=1 Tax=uncultured Sphingosinicella sp. TaxID=478748 RepID=A0A6J4UA70_9SPHN|nr:MAG: hypothetical protein AVDCRST_MAG23-2253 [uncultured Sphingosinicella sp.]